MVPVSLDVVMSDNCDPVPTCVITSVSCNEPENGIGYGDLAPDSEITGELTANLRCERFGDGNGRVYTLMVLGEDASGNSSTHTVGVTVPHDQGRKKGKK